MTRTDDHEVELLVRHLAEKYSGTFEEEQVADAVGRAREELEAAASQADFLPVFIQRRAQELLREAAAERDLDLSQVQQILFLDDRNTGRSQIAAAIANGKGDGLIRARSGGVDPGDEVQERITRLLQDRGDDAGEAEVSPMTGKAALASDVVVTMGLTDEQKHEMPAHGLHQIDWDDLGPIADDASAQDLDRIADDIEARVEELVGALLHDGLGDREVDPEVERELDQVIGELHAGPEGERRGQDGNATGMERGGHAAGTVGDEHAAGTKRDERRGQDGNATGMERGERPEDRPSNRL